MSIEKQETKGRTKIISLFDPGTFVELGAYMRRRDGKDDGEYDAVICGYGAVEGKLAFAFVQDSDRTHGAMDEAGALKIERLYEQAIMNGAPVIGVFDSAGAVVFDGAGALSAYGRVMACVADASGVIPQIAYVSGVCSGLAAMTVAMFDFTVLADGRSELYVNPVSVTGKPQMPSAAIIAKDDSSATASVRNLVEILPQNNMSGTVNENLDAPERDCNVTGITGAALVGALADNGIYSELYAGEGKEIVTALASIGGKTVGVVASDSSVSDGGRISSAGADKAAKLVKFCDSFNIPIVTLVDSNGVEQSADDRLATSCARLASAYLDADCAKISAIVGNAYGAAFVLLGSRALGADIALALPTSLISTMTPDAAVAFVWNDKITKTASRDDIESEWKEKYASPKLAASNGDIDDIVAPEELRARICAALFMLESKADGIPTKKHLSMPL